MNLAEITLDEVDPILKEIHHLSKRHLEDIAKRIYHVAEESVYIEVDFNNVPENKDEVLRYYEAIPTIKIKKSYN